MIDSTTPADRPDGLGARPASTSAWRREGPRHRFRRSRARPVTCPARRRRRHRGGRRARATPASPQVGEHAPRRRRWTRRPSPRWPRLRPSTSSWSAPRCRWSPGSPTPCAPRGIACFGPSAAAAQLEGSKAFAKQVMAEAGVPDRDGPRLHDRRRGRRGPRPVRRPLRRQGRRARRRQGRRRHDRPRRGAGARARLPDQRQRRAGRRRGVPRRPGGVAVRDHRRRDRAAAAARPGLQAGRRRRRGPEHRRHGRVLAAAVGAARAGRRRDRRGSCSRWSTRCDTAARRSPACSTPGSR